jgi:hypothetical protein
MFMMGSIEKIRNMGLGNIVGGRKCFRGSGRMG